MALIKSVRGFTPKMGENCYLADNATIIGDVEMGNDCSIWFNAGVPAKRIKTIKPQRLESMIKRIAKDYVMYAGWYKNSND